MSPEPGGCNDQPTGTYWLVCTLTVENCCINVLVWLEFVEDYKISLSWSCITLMAWLSGAFSPIYAYLQTNGHLLAYDIYLI